MDWTKIQEQIETVRASGLVNMLDMTGVVQVSKELMLDELSAWISTKQGQKDYLLAIISGEFPKK